LETANYLHSRNGHGREIWFLLNLFETDAILIWGFGTICSMPYTEAVLYEILRCSSILALGLFHMATEDVEFHGYTIPKGAYVAGNLHLSHHSTEYWDKPEIFNPERFLVTGEYGVVKVQRSENLMPFSVGKRVCLGESLARDEFFLFLTSIFQRFDVQLDPNSKKPELEPQKTFIGQPHPYKVIMKDRQ